MKKKKLRDRLKNLAYLQSIFLVLFFTQPVKHIEFFDHKGAGLLTQFLVYAWLSAWWAPIAFRVKKTMIELFLMGIFLESIQAYLWDMGGTEKIFVISNLLGVLFGAWLCSKGLTPLQLKFKEQILP